MCFIKLTGCIFRTGLRQMKGSKEVSRLMKWFAITWRDGLQDWRIQNHRMDPKDRCGSSFYSSFPESSFRLSRKTCGEHPHLPPAWSLVWQVPNIPERRLPTFAGEKEISPVTIHPQWQWRWWRVWILLRFSQSHEHRNAWEGESPWSKRRRESGVTVTHHLWSTSNEWKNAANIILIENLQSFCLFLSRLSSCHIEDLSWIVATSVIWSLEYTVAGINTKHTKHTRTTAPNFSRKRDPPNKYTAADTMTLVTSLTLAPSQPNSSTSV